MKEALTIKPGQIEFINSPVPLIAEDELLIKICRVGICGSDIHFYFGKHPFALYPMVQTHEASGVVVETGKRSEGFTVGDIVTVNPQIVCGKCYTCRHGDYNICENLKCMGFQAPGLMCEYRAVPYNKALRIPSEMSLDEGALVEPMAVAVHAVEQSGGVLGKNILVLGAGPIGNLVAQCAKVMGAAGVMIVDLNVYRLNIARECGIDYTINLSTCNLSETLVKHFGEGKADVIFECVGVNAAINNAIENARRGTRIVVGGVFGEKVSVDMALVQKRELNLIGTLMYKKDHFVKAINLISRNIVNLEKLVSGHFAFEDYPKVYDYIEENKVSGQVMKLLIDVGEPN